jgi:hypothetical protein
MWNAALQREVSMAEVVINAIDPPAFLFFRSEKRSTRAPVPAGVDWPGWHFGYSYPRVRLRQGAGRYGNVTWKAYTCTIEPWLPRRTRKV